jgi:hypothetical protein
MKKETYIKKRHDDPGTTQDAMVRIVFTIALGLIAGAILICLALPVPA